MKEIIFLGGTGGCADLIDLNNHINGVGHDYTPIGILDDAIQINETIYGIPVLGGFSMVKTIKYNTNIYFITGLGNAYNFHKRGFIIESLNIDKNQWANLIHPSATISKYASLGVGVVIHSGVYIGPNVQIKDHSMILPNCFIGHDSKIGEYTIINAGVNISGDVIIGDSCYIGTGATIRDHVVIENDCLIGMGSVVLRNCINGKKYFGSPAYEKN
jgi:sugar O-acyltransferase (sialic acid O-acetyltransferase NeuD family)